MPDFSTFWNSKDDLSSAFRLMTIVSLFATAGPGFALYKLNDRIGELQQRIIDAQGIQLGKQGQVLDRQNRLLEEQKARLTEVNAGLSEAVQRSESLLRQNADLQALVGRVADKNVALQKRADDLTTKAVAAERGVADTYDFNGGHRVRTAGRVVLTVGEETQVFQNLVQMQTAKEWSQLLSASKTQITKTPTWLTPYLFAGVAEVNLGNFTAAKSHLNYVEAHSGGDPAYSDAKRILSQLPQ